MYLGYSSNLFIFINLSLVPCGLYLLIYLNRIEVNPPVKLLIEYLLTRNLY